MTWGVKYQRQNIFGTFQTNASSKEGKEEEYRPKFPGWFGPTSGDGVQTTNIDVDSCVLRQENVSYTLGGGIKSREDARRLVRRDPCSN